jgi:Metal binding domain of Ada
VPPPALGGKRYTLLGADGRPYPATTPGRLGGHRRNKVYGRLDCPSALRAIAAGGYVATRVFFADERIAVAAGYRPCAVCLPAAYAAWKAKRTSGRWQTRPHRRRPECPHRPGSRCPLRCRAAPGGVR